MAGYITLLADKLELAQPILLDEGVQYRSFPAIKIGLLAVDRRAKGAGRRLVEWAVEYVAVEVSPKVGLRFMTVDALYDSDTNPPYKASGFYEKFGFQFADPNESLYFSISMIHYFQGNQRHSFMLTKYIQAALHKAKYKILTDDGTFFGEIPGFQGLWANADALETCREELAEVLEDWILLRISQNLPLPVVDGIELSIKEVA